MESPSESKVRYPDLVGFTSRVTLVVPPPGFCSKLLPPPSGMCLASSYLTMLATTLSLEGDPLYLGGAGPVVTAARTKTILD